MSEVYELDKGLVVIRQRIEKILKKASRPLIVGVAGGSGSGKTTKVAKEIQSYFPGSVIVSTDDYFKGRRFMKSLGIPDNFDNPRVVDLELLKKHLYFLKQKAVIGKPIYSFKAGEREGYVLFDPSYLIVLEGLFALYVPVVDEVDLKIFVDISIHGSLMRRLMRDIGRTGQTEQDIFRQYVETVYPMYKLHVEPTKSRADIVIINQYVPETEAGSCQIQEVQIKAFLRRRISPGKLEELGFRKQSNVFQQDIYYSAPNWGNYYRNELMRIRREGSRYFLAYKGPLCKGPFRIKPKIEFEVESSLGNTLKKLGYRKLFSLNKKRQKFSAEDGIELVIDTIENGGRFLEFRTKTPEGKNKVMEFLKKLGIKKKDVTKKSYLELLLDKKTSG